jgi:hypothetical protein
MADYFNMSGKKNHKRKEFDNSPNTSQDKFDDDCQNLNNSKENIPFSPHSEKSFKDFVKTSKAYYQELKNLESSLPNFSLSKDEVIVLNDILKEVKIYSEVLLKNEIIIESKKLIKIGEKTCDLIIKIFSNKSENHDKDKSRYEKETNNTLACLKWALALKLSILEVKFNIIFNFEHLYDESHNLIEEIYNLQSILNLPKFNLGCSTFFKALMKFFLNEIDLAEKLAFDALKIFEIKSLTAKEDEERVKYMENKTIRKISSVLEFLAYLYEMKKE